MFRIIFFVFIFLLAPIVSSAFEIHLRDGRVITTSSYQKSGDQILYEKYGGTIGVPTADVERIISHQVGQQGKVRKKVKTGVTVIQDEVVADLDARLREILQPKSPLEEASLSVVKIKTVSGAGSGFFISPKGLLLTNHHFVRSSAEQYPEVIVKIEAELKRFKSFDKQYKQESERISQGRKKLKESRKKISQFEEKARTAAQKKEAKQARAELKKDEEMYKKWEQDYLKRSQELETETRKAKKQLNELKTQQKQLNSQEIFDIQLVDGSDARAKLIAVNEKLDIALLKVSSYEVTPYLRQQGTEGSNAVKGSSVYAVGADKKSTQGLLAAYRSDFIQTDAHIDSGNTGGPLVTEDGEVIGICASTLISNELDGLGLAVRIERVHTEFGLLPPTQP